LVVAAAEQADCGEIAGSSIRLNRIARAINAGVCVGRIQDIDAHNI
jgi:hypothetical protein